MLLRGKSVSHSLTPSAFVLMYGQGNIGTTVPNSARRSIGFLPVGLGLVQCDSAIPRGAQQEQRALIRRGNSAFSGATTLRRHQSQTEGFTQATPVPKDCYLTVGQGNFWTVSTTFVLVRQACFLGLSCAV